MAENERSENGRKPEAKLSLGDVRGSVWLNTNEKGEPYYRATISLRYKTQDGYKNSSSYGLDDLADLAEVALATRKIIQEELQKLGLPEQTQGVRVSR